MFYQYQTVCANQLSPRGSDGIKGDPKDIHAELNNISDHTNLEVNVYLHSVLFSNDVTRVFFGYITQFVTSNCGMSP